MYLSSILVPLGTVAFFTLEVSASNYTSVLPPFPSIKAGPKVPANWQTPDGPNRAKVCTVQPNSTDAGPAILEAAKSCNQGGTVYIPKGEYKISTALDLTFLDHIDFAIYGNITFDDDISIWPSQAFQYPYQTVSLFWRFGGTDVNIYGGGEGSIDGKGPTYWVAMTSNSSVMRPTMFGTDGLHRSTITGLSLRNSPGWFNFIGNSSNVLISDFNLYSKSTNSSAPAKNTDGWDTYRSSNIIIQDSVIVNTDDCVSFKPNSTSVIIQGLDCTGSHGISVGSLGQYPGEIDNVEDIYVYNITMKNSTDGARIKVWPGLNPENPKPDQGGGSGRVRNITYEQFHNWGNDHAIALTQCYYAASQELCNKYPSSITMDDIKFLDFTGINSKKYDPRIGEIVCSSPEICTNFVANNVNVTTSSGKPAQYTCVNFDKSQFDINCVTP